jgi:hypothetical protein
VSRWWLFTSGTAVVGAKSSLVGEVFSGQFAEAAADGAGQAELALRGDHIAEITSFLGAGHFRPFRLPASLP